MTYRANAVWIISDLQIRSQGEAEQVLGQAIRDMQAMALPLEAIWCLGDVLEGSNLPNLEAAAPVVATRLESLTVPIWCVMGNHDTDYRRASHSDRCPLFELVAGRPAWHTAWGQSVPWLRTDWAGYQVYFLDDHATGNNTWFNSFGTPAHAPENYPYSADILASLRDEMAQAGCPILTASHYAFPGGQRPGALPSLLLPLPKNTKGHFYGHAHIGDTVWNPEYTWQRRFQVQGQGQTIPQLNISALEFRRTPSSHSAVLTTGGRGELNVRIRCHQNHAWMDEFILP